MVTVENNFKPIFNPEEFDEICNSLWIPLFNYACRRLPNQDDAADAVQDVFEKLWKIKHYEDCSKVNSLLYKMMKNGLIDKYKKKDPIETELNDDHFSGCLTVEEIENEIEVSAGVRENIAALNNSQQQILTGILDGMTDEEIRGSLGIGRAAYRTRKYRAKKSLKKILQEKSPEF